jgi:hypothetical protein
MQWQQAPKMPSALAQSPPVRMQNVEFHASKNKRNKLNQIDADNARFYQ